ncbi:MAG: GTP cyclohydrolase FolE2 [Treponema sp.]|nr:GTP cyclohydrolase FolE2 [Spirochaetales bacterium]MDY5810655.1 GTP cyclohydrolase FolE2 [Treponema sp.]MEE1181385.1 GTP cyclohydrolase FolE2 [Treponema sp.]
MIDIQNSVDEREIPLKKVGVRNVEYPVAVLDKKNKIQNTTATLDLFVNLPHHFKGTHMSRFIEVFHKYRKDISINHFTEMLEEIRNKLTAERAFGKITFPYFIEKEAPVSKSKGFIKYTCTYEAEVSDKEKKFYLEVKVPVTTLCPCSKAISDYGAHNQRGTVTVKVLYRDFFWLEDLIEAVEKSASSPLYSVLKRQDEKYVTEHAYDNPRFVEDVVREVYIALKEFEGGGKFSWFSVEAENEESIHAHNAYAYTECNL